MSNTNGITRRTCRGRAVQGARPGFKNWFTDKLATLSIKEVAALGECSEDTAENIKLGRCTPKGDIMTAMFQNSPELGAMYLEYIGLLRPGEAETAAAYTRFVNAAVRLKP
jgi:hypothetical protein